MMGSATLTATAVSVASGTNLLGPWRSIMSAASRGQATPSGAGVLLCEARIPDALLPRTTLECCSPGGPAADADVTFR